MFSNKVGLEWKNCMKLTCFKFYCNDVIKNSFSHSLTNMPADIMAQTNLDVFY